MSEWTKLVQVLTILSCLQGDNRDGDINGLGDDDFYGEGTSDASSS